MLRSKIPGAVATVTLLVNLIAYTAATLAVGFFTLLLWPGLFRALGNTYNVFDFLKAMNIPSNIYNMLPYIVSLIVLAFTSKNSKAPKAEGIPYDKGSR